MDVTSFRLLIYKQTRRLFFKRKLYKTLILFCFVLFCLFLFVFFGFSHSLPFLDFLQEEEDSYETVLMPTQRNTTPQTGAIIHWSLEKTTHTHTHILQNLCYYTLVDLPFSPKPETLSKFWRRTEKKFTSIFFFLIFAQNISDFVRLFNQQSIPTVNPQSAAFQYYLGNFVQSIKLHVHIKDDMPFKC